MPKWIDRLQEKWNLKSAKQVVLVLIVFACTGTTVLLLKKPVFSLLGITEIKGWLSNILYLIFILPVYNIVLLIYGALFGQFAFFWEYEKKMFRRMGSIFKKKS